MTRDDIERMAVEAGGFIPEWRGIWELSGDALERLATLVAAAEREACAKVCERLPETFKIAADEFGYEAEVPTAENYAAAIRARGEA